MTQLKHPAFPLITFALALGLAASSAIASVTTCAFAGNRLELFFVMHPRFTLWLNLIVSLGTVTLFARSMSPTIRKLTPWCGLPVAAMAVVTYEGHRRGLQILGGPRGLAVWTALTLVALMTISISHRLRRTS